MTLLTIMSDPAKGAAVRCGLTAPASLFGSSDPNAPLLIACAQEHCEDLLSRHDWQVMKVDYTVATLAAEAQTALPADYDHMVGGTEMWNRTTGLRYNGPTDDFTWGRIKALGIPSATGNWRLIGGALRVTPAPAAGNTLAFTYISKNFARSNAGAPLAAFSADTDTTVIPENLVGLGVIWRWKAKKGLAYAEDLANHERAFEIAASRDRGPRVITVGKSRRDGGVSSTWPGRIA